MQPFSVADEESLSADTASLDVYRAGQPTKFDFMQYVADQCPDREAFRIYSFCRSDYYDGALCLHTPRKLVPQTKLTSSKASVLALVDTLEAQYYIGVWTQSFALASRG